MFAMQAMDWVDIFIYLPGPQAQQLEPAAKCSRTFGSCRFHAMTTPEQPEPGMACTGVPAVPFSAGIRDFSNGKGQSASPRCKPPLCRRPAIQGSACRGRAAAAILLLHQSAISLKGRWSVLPWTLQSQLRFAAMAHSHAVLTGRRIPKVFIWIRRAGHTAESFETAPFNMVVRWIYMACSNIGTSRAHRRRVQSATVS